MKIAGLDIGTTSAKLTVFDENGTMLGKIDGVYRTTRETGRHETDAMSLRDSVIDILSRGATEYPDIAGIGITSFGESFVLSDENFTPLFPVMLYTDPRGRDECDGLCQKIGRKRLEEITALKPHEMYSLPKIMYVRKHYPEIFRKTKHITLIAGYVASLLSGNCVTDYSLASRTMAFDVNKLDFSDEILNAAGIDRALFSKPVETGTPVGKITGDMARLTGLPEGCVIVITGHDQIGACVGAGLRKAGCAVDGSGTVECITPCFDTIPPAGKIQEDNYNVVPYRGKYVSYAFSYTGGALLQWCAGQICGTEARNAEKAGLPLMRYLESPSDYHITGKLVLPHFAGAATPYMDTGSRGAIVGLSLSDSAREIYYACLEGVAYEMRLNIEKMAEDGIKINRLIAAGGGSKSGLWLQIKSDVTGLPIDVLESKEAGTVGSALQAGIACGIFRDEDEASAKMIKIAGTIEPNPENKLRYDEIYSRYLRLYDAVRPLV